MIFNATWSLLAIPTAFALLNTRVRPANECALADSDYVVAGVAIDDSQIVVERRLGRPDSLSDSGFEWRYRGLTFSISEGRVEAITLQTPRYQTARGLRVGDSIARARTLYGTACIMVVDDGLEVLVRSAAQSGNRGMRLGVQNERITDILLGRVFQD